MDALVELVERVRKVRESCGIPECELPVFVIIGSQSSGKSSLLVKIIGRDIIPRGVGIVTRCPLVLNIRNTIGKCDGGEEWGEFSHLEGKKFFDMEQIREEIRSFTDKVAGKNKGISPHPIELFIYSPKLAELSFVDLPGLSNVSVGDQPPETPVQTEALALRYISDPNAIILAISPINDDLANSDSLKLALRVDKLRERTMGIITKLDLAEKETDYTDILRGESVPLKLGYFGIVNRNLKDIVFKKSLEMDYESEKRFFLNAPKFALVADRCGVDALLNELANVIKRRIAKYAPQIKRKVSQQSKSISKEIDSLSVQINSLQEKKEFFRNAIYKNIFLIKRLIGGYETIDCKAHAGALASMVVEEFIGSMSKINLETFLVDSEVKFAILNTSAIYGPFSLSPSFYIAIMRKPLKFLEEQCLRAGLAALSELESMKLSASCDDNLNRVNELIYEIIAATVEKHKQSASNFIKNLFLAECNFINFYDSEFMSLMPEGRTLEIKMDDIQKKTADIKKLLNVYFEIIKNEFLDLIPKLIVREVNVIMDDIEIALLDSFQNTQLIEDIVHVTSAPDRKEALSEKQTLLESLKALLDTIK